MSYYYGVVLLYPLISVLITRVLGTQGGWGKQIKNEYYLLGGVFLVYAAILFVLLVPKVKLGAFPDFIIFTIFYFAVSILRKTAFTEPQTPVVKALDR